MSYFAEIKSRSYRYQIDGSEPTAPVAKTPGGDSIHEPQLAVIDANLFMQLHYDMTDYNADSQLVACNEAGTHDFARRIELERFASDDVHLLSTTDGTPV